jgi:hypothetical protein
MTRETKIGLVVSCSFVCLVSVVLYGKMKESEAPDASPYTEADGSLPAIPEEPVAMDNANSESVDKALDTVPQPPSFRPAPGSNPKVVQAQAKGEPDPTADVGTPPRTLSIPKPRAKESDPDKKTTNTDTFMSDFWKKDSAKSETNTTGDNPLPRRSPFGDPVPGAKPVNKRTPATKVESDDPSGLPAANDFGNNGKPSNAAAPNPATADDPKATDSRPLNPFDTPSSSSSPIPDAPTRPTLRGSPKATFPAATKDQENPLANPAAPGPAFRETPSGAPDPSATVAPDPVNPRGFRSSKDGPISPGAVNDTVPKDLGPKDPTPRDPAAATPVRSPAFGPNPDDKTERVPSVPDSRISDNPATVPTPPAPSLLDNSASGAPRIDSSAAPAPAAVSGSPSAKTGADLLRPVGTSFDKSPKMEPESALPARELSPRQPIPTATADGAPDTPIKLGPPGAVLPSANQYAQGSPPPVLDPTPSAASPSRPLAPLGAQAIVDSPPIALPTPPNTARPMAPIATVVESYDEMTVVCKPADTLATISKQYYNTEKYEKALLLFNRNHPRAADSFRQDVPMLRPGDAVYLPPLRILEKQYGSAIPGHTPATTPIPGAPAPTPAPAAATSTSGASPAGYRSYIVRKEGGEAILDIARRTLGAGDRWYEIGSLNPQVNPKYPIPVGSVLRLPADARTDTGDNQ